MSNHDDDHGRRFNLRLLATAMSVLRVAIELLGLVL